MFIVDSFNVAIMMCVITMICWGSHANMLKMQSKGYSYSYYYWDQAIGYVLLPLLLALTIGSTGAHGESFISNLQNADASAWMWAIGAAFVFNLANIIFVASVDIAGMAVAFPVGMGFALSLGVILNYIAKPEGNPVLIFSGVLCVIIAIIINARAYSKMSSQDGDKSMVKKGIILAIVGGFLMALFYYLLQNSLPEVLNYESLANIAGTGKFTPYSAVFVFALASFFSNFIYNSYVMKHPFKGNPVTYKGYFQQSGKDHLIGIVGGVINATGTSFNIIASGVVGAAIAYALGQSNPMIAAIWGVFVWKEFKNAPKGTNKLIALMFLFFASGVVLLTLSK